MTSDVTTVGPWTAAATASLMCQFEPTDWLFDRVDAGERSVDALIAVTVEVRLRAGGMAPCALVGARFVSSDRADTELAVGHSAELAEGVRPSCVGLLGRSLVSGLPKEFAEGVLNGLVRVEAPLPPGRLEVVAAGYDDVDSSEFAFERAAGLLRHVLSDLASNKEFGAPAIAEVLREWHT
ncbi:MAG TPA: hypothetical protein VFP54_04925 [Acidimicrobiales bacterium]|nr:hypothetical protein [Acidimicrobiales bacterium]